MSSQAGINRRNGGLPRAELAALRASLLDQRAFRREQLAGIRHRSADRSRELPGEPSGHLSGEPAADQGTARAEVRGHLAVAARIVLADVEAALDRMHTGHYGHCRACRGPIGLPRLRICPQALYCAECHRLQESDGR